MSTLIFGGGGFVGLSIAEQLLGRGEAVTIADRTRPPEGALAAFATLPGKLGIALGDVRDGAFVGSAFDTGPARIVWGAAITADAARDAADPEGVLAINLAALVPVLRQARDRGVKRVVNLSSVAAIGDAAYAAGPDEIGEDTRCEPIGLYSLTKFATERVVDRMADLWGLDALSVRLSSVYGPWERKTGERDTPSPLFQIARLAARGEPARLLAPSTRDWVLSRDVADAVVTLLDAAKPRHRVYHISSGASFSALAFAERLTREVPALDARLSRADEKPSVDIFGTRERARLSIARLSEEFGWRPRFAALEPALAEYRAWQRAHPAYWEAATR
jgi:UDP-glucose 4-epimerase